MKKLLSAVLVILGLFVGSFHAYASGMVLSSACTDTPDTVLNWSVANSDSVDNSFTWDRGGVETGSGNALQSTTTTFTTGSSGRSTPETLTISWTDASTSAVLTSTASANYLTRCTPLSVAPVVTTLAPVQVSEFRPSGRRHPIPGSIAPVAQVDMSSFVDSSAATSAKSVVLNGVSYPVSDIPVTISELRVKMIWLLEQIVALYQAQAKLQTR